MSNGKFIVFEGIDGCGKTTQLRRLQSWLAEVRPDIKTYATREPGGTSLGVSLRELLKATPHLAPETELFLHLADRSHHVKQVIEPMIADGVWVLSDRHADSTIAYQGYGSGLEIRTLDRLDILARGFLESDLVIWIDTDTKVARDRIQLRPLIDDGWALNDQAFYQKVAEGYKKIWTANKGHVLRVNGNDTEEEVARLIRDAVADWMAKL